MLPVPSPPSGTPPHGPSSIIGEVTCGRLTSGQGAPIGQLHATLGIAGGASHPQRHFSTPVTTTPRMNARWARKNTTTGTAMVISAAAWISGRLGVVQRVVLLDRDRQRLQVRLAGQVQQRQEEVVPREEEVEQADRGDRRHRQRQDDRAQDPERARAVDHRRLVEVARDRHEVLAQQEHVERVGEEVRDDQRQPRPGPAQLGEHARTSGSSVTWNGQDDRRDQDDEQDVLAGEPEAGEPVGHEGRRQHGADACSGPRPRPVLNSSLGKLSCDQTVVKFVDLRTRTSTPAGSVRHAPCQTIGVWVGVRRVDERALRPALLDQHQVAIASVDRDAVDRVGLALVRSRRRRSRDRTGAPAVVRWPASWNDERDHRQQRQQERAQEHHGEQGQASPGRGTRRMLRATGPPSAKGRSRATRPGGHASPPA